MAAPRANHRLFLGLSLIILIFVLAACSQQKTAEYYLGQGKAFLTAKQYDQAIENFNEAIKLDPKSVQAYNNRGIAYCNKEDLDRAIGDFGKVIELDPNNSKAYNNRAVAYLMKRELDKARQDVAKAQSLGLQVNQMLIDALKEAEGRGAPPGMPQFPAQLPPGVTAVPVPPGAPAPSVPSSPQLSTKPETGGKPEAKGAEPVPAKPAPPGPTGGKKK